MNTFDKLNETQGLILDHEKGNNPLPFNKETGYTIISPEDAKSFINQGWRMNSSTHGRIYPH